MDKKLFAEPFLNIRGVVNFINEYHIQKEDIFNILSENGQLILLYYGRG